MYLDQCSAYVTRFPVCVGNNFTLSEIHRFFNENSENILEVCHIVLSLLFTTLEFLQ